VCREEEGEVMVETLAAKQGGQKHCCNGKGGGHPEDAPMAKNGNEQSGWH
jgi:hypothetical protein